MRKGRGRGKGHRVDGRGKGERGKGTLIDNVWKTDFEGEVFYRGYSLNISLQKKTLHNLYTHFLHRFFSFFQNMQ
jgi:hypothetical protein